jgi:hypothetical protein
MRPAPGPCNPEGVTPRCSLILATRLPWFDRQPSSAPTAASTGRPAPSTGAATATCPPTASTTSASAPGPLTYGAARTPDQLARMRAVERARKAASRARLRAVDPGHEAWLTKSRLAATRRLITAHLEEYRALLRDERRQVDTAVSGGGPDAA